MRLGLFALLILGCGLSNSYAQTVAIVSTPYLNMRAEPTKQSPIVAVLARGTQVMVLDDSGGFVQVRRLSDGKVGYMSRNYLLMSAIDLAPTQQVTADIGNAEPVLEPKQDPPNQIPEALPVEVVSPDVVITSADSSVLNSPRELAVKTLPTKFSPWSVSLQAGYAQSNVGADQLERTLRSAAGFAQVHELDESSPSWGLNISYSFTPIWSLELGALALGSYDSRIDIRNADQTAVRVLLADQHPVGGTGLRAAIRAQKQLARWSPSASLGLFRSSGTDIEAIIDGQKQTVEGESISVVIDATVAYRVSCHWSAELGVSYLKLNQTIVKPAFALRYSL